MPQDSLRSAVHRCLSKTLPVGFEDENETVQCGTSRRSKTSLSVSLRPIDGRGHGGPDLMPFKGKEKEVMTYQDHSKLQLLQVFTGARKLNQMIGSWSKAATLDERWKYFADDLLRSALDLQESLIMLEKLQNAPKLMSRMDRKQKPEFIYQRKQELEQENNFDASGSKRFAGGSNHNGLQEPRHSVDRSSRNLVEELKKVIGDSLYKQNLLSSSSDDEKASSSKSLRYSRSKGSRDKPREQKVEVAGSILASDQPNKPKAPNLIAKLMGLEEVPSETVHPIKKEEKRKSINSPRQSLDIERPKARKLQFVQQIPDPKRTTLNEIIETVQFNDLLKSSQVEDHRFQPCFFDAQLKRYARDFYRDDVPPIVIVKSPHLRCWERGEVQKELTLEKVTVKEQRRSTKLVQEEKASDQTNMVTNLLERKEVKPREKTKEKSSPNVKAIASSFQKQQGKEAFKAHIKPNGEQKPLLLNEKKQEVKKNVKATKVSISHLNTSAAPAKPDTRLSAARDHIASTHINTSQSQNLKRSSKSVAQNFSDSTKEKKIAGAKLVKRSNMVKANDDKKSKEDGKLFNSHNKTDSVSTTTSNFSGDELPEQADQGTKPCNRDDTIKTRNVSSEVMRKTNQVRKISESGEAAIQHAEKKATIGEAAAIEDDLKLLLLSSQSFLNRAQELFHVDAIRPVCYQSKGKDEVGKRNTKLLMDIAEELMVCKSHQQKHLIHSSVQTNLWGRIVYHSLDQLVDEISNEIGELTINSTVDDHATTADSLNVRLEGDLKCKDAIVNAMWDFGWVDWISMEDTGQIVGEVGEHILAWLIEEAATELVY